MDWELFFIALGVGLGILVASVGIAFGLLYIIDRFANPYVGSFVAGLLLILVFALFVGAVG